MGRDGGDVPSESAEKQQLPRQHLLVSDGIVRVQHQLVGCERLRFLEFGGDEHGDGGDQLEMLLLDGDLGQESVEVIHRQCEHVVLALLLFAYLRKLEKEFYDYFCLVYLVSKKDILPATGNVNPSIARILISGEKDSKSRLSPS